MGDRQGSGGTAEKIGRKEWEIGRGTEECVAGLENV